jgi:hypothetical protein
MRVLLLAGSPPDLPDDMPIFALASQNVLVRHQPVKSDGSARVDPPRADPHLRTEPIAKTVREARARVHEHSRRVDAVHEGVADGGRLGDDAVGMVRAVLVDVGDGGGEGGHGAHGERKREVFGRVGFGCCWGYVRREVRMGGRVVSRRR